MAQLNSALSCTHKFEPPHCVNPKCFYFHEQNIYDKKWRDEHSSYFTKTFGRVQRYRCTFCGKTFSDQSFSIDYYAKKKVDYPELLKALLSTSGQGNMTRFTGLSCETIQNRFERLSRMFLAIQSELRKNISYEENVVLDGFETFSYSKYYPSNINYIVGDESEFIYGMSFSQLRRKGRMTREQKEKRQSMEERSGKAPPKAVEMSVYRMCKDFMNEKDFLKDLSDLFRKEDPEDGEMDGDENKNECQCREEEINADGKNLAKEKPEETIIAAIEEIAQKKKEDAAEEKTRNNEKKKSSRKETGKENAKESECLNGKKQSTGNRKKITIKSDEHKAYDRAFHRIEGFYDHFDHKKYSSKTFRNKGNPLFAVNYIDRQIRKDQVNHVRKSIQFARCPSAQMSRLSIYEVYHNCIMPKRVKEQRRGNWQTRAEFLGIPGKVLFKIISRIIGKRVFFHKHDLWEDEKSTWFMRWRNKGIKMGRYVPGYIAA